MDRTLWTCVVLLSILTELWICASVPIQSNDGQQLFIVGGSDRLEAIPHEFPWQVSVRSNLNDEHLCGGVIVDTFTVLTTADCAERLLQNTFTVAAGKHNISALEESQQNVTITSIHIHPDFPGNTDYSNNIAVLKMRTAFIWNEFVGPVPKLLEEDLINAEFGTISGWGTKAEEEITSQSTLHKANVTFLSNTDCQELVGSAVTVEDSMICISSPDPAEPVDSCTGDQGGPLVITDESGSPVLAGLISFGIGCGRPNVPSFCSRVSSYIDFIRQYQESRDAPVGPESCV